VKWVPYMSYWSRGYQGAPTDFIKDIHWLAAHYLKLNYGEVHLITDSIGAGELKDIGWSSVSLDLDDLDPDLGKWCWAAGKLAAFKIAAERGKPFFHADYDVFLPSGITPEMDHSGVFAQSPEDVVESNYELPRVLPLIPNTGIMSECPSPFAANTGVFGGHNLAFIHQYATEILDLASHPDNDILKTRRIYGHYGGASMLFEQYGLACVAKKHGVTIDFIFSGWPSSAEVREKQYIHLMGGKRSLRVRQKIADLVPKLKAKTSNLYANTI
jgi:hypothetical protein